MSTGVCRLLFCIMSIQDMWQHFFNHIKFGKNLFSVVKQKNIEVSINSSF
jgi:hypothetical protein